MLNNKKPKYCLHRITKMWDKLNHQIVFFVLISIGIFVKKNWGMSFCWIHLQGLFHKVCIVFCLCRSSYYRTFICKITLSTCKERKKYIYIYIYIYITYVSTCVCASSYISIWLQKNSILYIHAKCWICFYCDGQTMLFFYASESPYGNSPERSLNQDVMRHAILLTGTLRSEPANTFGQYISSNWI